MARSPETADPFFREVDDAVRADRLQGFFARFGIPLLVLIVVGLLALGGWLYWNHHQKTLANESGRQFVAAIDAMAENRTRAAASQAELVVKDGSANYQLLGRMIQGYASEVGNDLNKAATSYGAAAGVADADPTLRNLALLRQTVAQFDTLPPATVITRLKDIVATNGPAFPPAAELTALAHIKAGDNAAAAALYQRIAASSFVSEGMKRRAQQMASGLSGTAPAAAASSASAAPAAAQSATRATPVSAAPAAQGENR